MPRHSSTPTPRIGNLQAWGGRTLVFLLAATVTMTFLINFCHLVFQCGCQSLWNGAAQLCNIHQPGVRPCPWCSSGTVAGLVPYASILLGQAAAAFWPRPWSLGWRLALAMAAFPLLGGLAALAFGWATGYWR